MSTASEVPSARRMIGGQMARRNVADRTRPIPPTTRGPPPPPCPAPARDPSPRATAGFRPCLVRHPAARRPAPPHRPSDRTPLRRYPPMPRTAHLRQPAGPRLPPAPTTPPPPAPSRAPGRLGLPRRGDGCVPVMAPPPHSPARHAAGSKGPAPLRPGIEPVALRYRAHRPGGPTQQNEAARSRAQLHCVRQGLHRHALPARQDRRGLGCAGPANARPRPPSWYRPATSPPSPGPAPRPTDQAATPGATILRPGCRPPAPLALPGRPDRQQPPPTSPQSCARPAAETPRQRHLHHRPGHAAGDRCIGPTRWRHQR